MPLQSIERLKSPLAVACHDAGATNLIIGWLKMRPDLEFRATVAGPAQILWRLAFPDAPQYTLEDALTGSTALLCGTGWNSHFEFDASAEARRRGIQIIAAIDHWVNYRERFVRAGVEVLPDEIWVSDEYAFARVKDLFPGTPVAQMPNCYLEAQVHNIAACSTARPPGPACRILYALEPIRQAWSDGRAQSGEMQALDYFLENISVLRAGPEITIRLRPHPSDPPGKYDAWIKSARAAGPGGLHIQLSSGTSLAEDVAWSDWVVGCQSYVLVVALHAGRRVASTLPPWAPPHSIPYERIAYLRDLIRQSA